MRGKLLIRICFLLILACNVTANTWTNSTGNCLWSDAGNWTGNTPSSFEEVLVEGGKAAAQISHGVTGNAYDLNIGLNDSGAEVLINSGGALAVQNSIKIGVNAGSSGILSTNFDDSCIDTNCMDCGCWQTVRCYTLDVGQAGSGTLIMNGGTVRVYSEWLNIAAWDANGTGHVQLNDGTIHALGLTVGETGSIDIRKGTLIIQKDMVNDPTYGDIIGNWVSSGQITAYGGFGTIVYDHNISNPDRTTITAVCGASCCGPCQTPGDFDEDCYIHTYDLAVMANNWLKSSCSILGNLNDDCVVNFRDYAILGTNWTKAPKRGLSGSLALSVDSNGVLLQQGQPYRGYGVNFFDGFHRTLDDGNDISYNAAFQVLVNYSPSIPFARLAGCHFWASGNALYLNNKEEYFRRFDAVVASAERRGVGLIIGLFWTHWAIPDLLGEPCNSWGDPNSQTIAYMRDYVRDVVTRYVDSPAICGWSLGNEWNLYADVGSVYLPPIAAHLGTPPTRSSNDYITHEIMVYAISEFAKEVRKYDPTRIISSGNSHPLPQAWNLWQNGTWVDDTSAQHAQMLELQNPDPTNVISIHHYPVIEPYDISLAMSVAQSLKKPLWVGEFGVSDDGRPQLQIQADYNDLINTLKTLGVPISALWVYDLDSQEGSWNCTPINTRSYQLDIVSQANQP